MTERQHSQRSTDRDDADARGEHLYRDGGHGRQRSAPSPLDRDPDRYAAGANGTQAVTTMAPSGSDAKTDSATLEEVQRRGTDSGSQER